MKRPLRVSLLVIAVVVVIIQFVPVDRSNPPVQGVVAAPPEVFHILERACFNCHSNQTDWPWYGYVAPVSWIVAHHVEEARDEVNFTEWNTLDPAKQAKKIGKCWEEIEEGKMPLPGYVRIHAEARLSDGEKVLIRDWAMVAGGGASEGEEDHSGHDD